ncbi:peptidylprolyl isomerase domain and WD repeat-containing protein 1-like [Ornithodoros turicata]|uniref:peptidylprolyl isomerase domain and WD repeat-containing protein 1-like n=1 Tax=Ornithodoros turicata TaxID=34597 RepID=UPI003139BFFB
MSVKMAEKHKIEVDSAKDEDSQDDVIGPLPSEAIPRKRRRVLPLERVYLENLPCAEAYEKSYMHRDTVTHVIVTKTDFVITASCDGHIKFWKKREEGIEFVKHFRTHLGNVQDLAANCTGLFLSSVSSDKTLKVFDIVNFDLINMMKLPYSPGRCEWVYGQSDPIAAVAVSDAETGAIYVYDGRGSEEAPMEGPAKGLLDLHRSPVTIIKYNPKFDTAISVDKQGIVEYWTGQRGDFGFPKHVEFQSKLDTDLYEFVKAKTYLTGLTFSPDGYHFATMATDRKVRVFRFLTGKLVLVLDEGLQQLSQLQQMQQQLPDMEFGRRMAAERDLEKSESFLYCNLAYDDSGHFLMYATLLGIKVINLHSRTCVRLLGKNENIRPLHIALFQGVAGERAAPTVEMCASDNPTLDAAAQPDPTLVCSAFKKNRFYLFSRREPDESKAEERDVFNERPSKEDIMSATQASSVTQRLFPTAIIHTTMGDIQCSLFVKECPRTVENFCVHAKNGYYNGHLFHRVIKGFMVQTGDPTGTGTGGESIWGGEFEDEFHPTLKHDRPYTLSMANAGPNTNGSQFFLTVIPAPWLDNKHTVFGRVTRGMESVQNISTVRTHPKTDKPYDDVRIVSITLK